MKTYKANCPELTATLRRDEVKKVKVSTSKDCADFFRELWEGMDIYESFFCVYLNQGNNTIGWYKVSQGGITGTVADPRLIVKKALEVLATGLVICHNHPSGTLKPSTADEQITQKIKEGCKYFDIRLIDHIILTEDGYYSFNDEGIL